MLESVVCPESLREHSLALQPKIEEAVNIVVAQCSQAKTWLHGSYARYLLNNHQRPGAKKFESWSDADLLFIFSGGFAKSVDFLQFKRRIGLTLAEKAESRALVDYYLVNPCVRWDDRQGFMRKIDQYQEGIVIFDHGKFSFPW